MKFHHVGIVVASLTEGLAYYRDLLGLTPTTDIVHDPQQQVNLILLADPTHPAGATIELIEPATPTSPVARTAASGGGPAHTCYEVDDLPGELARLQSSGALVVRPPTPAPLFGGRRVAFLLLKNRHLIELLEATVA